MGQRVGILTLPLDTNYGGMLQAVALYAFLARNGKDVIFLDRREPQRLRRRVKTFVIENIPAPVIRATAGTPVGRRLRRQARLEYDMSRHRAFLRQRLPRKTGRLYDTAAMRRAVDRRAIGAIVVGSDQVWNYGLQFDGGAETYFGGFLEGRDVRRVAYAASFGHARWGFPHLTDLARRNLATFAAVSVREASGVRLCAEAFGRHDCVHVVDPTLLLPRDFYESMTAGTPAADRPTLLEYILDADADRDALTREALAALGPGLAPRRLSADDGKAAVDVPGWVAAFRDARFVMTDSFHGTIFAIMFREDFISIVNPERGADRFHSLLDQLGLADRLIARGDVDRVPALVRTPIDFEAAHRRIERLREASARFLLSALD